MRQPSGRVFCCDIKAGVASIGCFFLIMHTTVLLSCFVQLDHDEVFDQHELQEFADLQDKNDRLSAKLSSTIIGMIANIALLYSAARGNRLMLLPWLITYAPLLFLFPIFFTMKSSKYFKVAEKIEDALFVFFTGSMFSALLTYCWFAVLKLYQELSLIETAMMSISQDKQDKHKLVNDADPKKSAPIPPPYEHDDNLQIV